MMTNISRIHVIEKGIMQCSEHNFCTFCNPIIEIIEK